MLCAIDWMEGQLVKSLLVTACYMFSHSLVLIGFCKVFDMSSVCLTIIMPRHDMTSLFDDKSST